MAPFTQDEAAGSFGPFKGTVKGSVTIIVLVMALGFASLGWLVSEDTKAAAALREQMITSRIANRAEHDTILLGQQAIVRAQEDNTCMLALPAVVRPAAVAWTRTVSNDKLPGRSVCEYVVQVYLAKRPSDR